MCYNLHMKKFITSTFKSIKLAYCRLFPVPAEQNNIAVFFDGDSVNVKLFSDLASKIPINAKFWWVMTAGASMPKKVKASGATIEASPNIGKESVDMLLAMLAMQQCCTNCSLKEVHIISSDGDTLEILLNLASRFEKIKFFWGYPNSSPRSKKSTVASVNLPANIFVNKISQSHQIVPKPRV